MAIDSTYLSIISASLTLLIAVLLWIRIHLIARKLDFTAQKKLQITIFSGIALVGWFFLALALALFDIYHVTPQFLSPLVPIGFFIPVLIGYWLMKNSVTVQKILDNLSQEWLILIQTYRFGGIVFLFLLAQGQLPAMFAIPSGVGDVIIGLSAPIVAFFYWKKKSFSKKLAITWNIVGIVDLIIAIGTGVILVFPPSFQINAATPTTEIMTQFPLVLVPAFAVPLGLLLHVFSLRLLLKQKK